MKLFFNLLFQSNNSYRVHTQNSKAALFSPHLYTRIGVTVVSSDTLSVTEQLCFYFSFIVPQTFAAASDTMYDFSFSLKYFFITRSHLGLEPLFKWSINKEEMMLKFNISDLQLNYWSSQSTSPPPEYQFIILVIKMQPTPNLVQLVPFT